MVEVTAEGVRETVLGQDLAAGQVRPRANAAATAPAACPPPVNCHPRIGMPSAQASCPRRRWPISP